MAQCDQLLQSIITLNATLGLLIWIPRAAIYDDLCEYIIKLMDFHKHSHNIKKILDFSMLAIDPTFHWA